MRNSSKEQKSLDVRSIHSGFGSAVKRFLGVKEATHPVSRGPFTLSFNLRLVAQNHVQQGTVDFDSAVVINKPQLSKFVHEKTDTRSRRADHLREGLLADFCYYSAPADLPCQNSPEAEGPVPGASRSN
jgi:hypothetical protein